jgi:hypothetical protein
MQHDCPPEVEAGADAGHIVDGGGAQLLGDEAVDVLGTNAARCELLAVSRLAEKRLAPQSRAGVLDGLLEREVLEGVQRVVVDEDADRPLRRQQVRQPLEFAHQRVVRWADVRTHCGLEL